MLTIYTYLLDTMADWELGYVLAELNSGRFFKKGAQQLTMKTVGCTQAPIKTMGGLTVVPDSTIDEIAIHETSVLLLPGADTWHDPKHSAMIEKAGEMLACGATVCAICGATAALANAGLLDKRPHTSNGAGYLEMFAPGYRGQAFYMDAPSVTDNNLITAGSTGALPWAKQIIERLNVFEPDTLEAWYAFFRTGEPAHFFALMRTLSSGNEAD